MKKKIIILLLTIIFMAPVVTHAQLGNFIKNKVSKGLNAVAKEKVNEVDSAAQKRATESENNPGTKEKENGGENQGGMDLGKLFGGKVDLTYNDEYRFSSRLYMITETYDKKEVVKMELYMYYSANTSSIGMETKSFTDQNGNTAPLTSSMVMDIENKCFIILTEMNNMKMGIISQIPDEDSLPQSPDGKPAHKIYPSNFTKTGNTRVIAGYRCDEYTYTDEQNKSTGKLWFTKDADLKIDKRGWQRTGMGAYYGYNGFEGGIVLANEAYNEKGKLIVKTETQEINPNLSHLISIKGVTLRQMNLTQGKQKN
jgi:hypothetical protein